MISLASNTPRLVLNFYEFFNIKAFRKSAETDDCFPLPPWVLVTTSINLVLITSNASTNFFIYCFVNTTFRGELSQYWKKFLKRTGLEKVCDTSAILWNKTEIVIVDDNNGDEQSILQDKKIGKDITVISTLADSHATNCTRQSLEKIEMSNFASESARQIASKEQEIDAGCKNPRKGKIDESELENTPLCGKADNACGNDKEVHPKDQSGNTTQPSTSVTIYCNYEAVHL